MVQTGFKHVLKRLTLLPLFIHLLMAKSWENNEKIMKDNDKIMKMKEEEDLFSKLCIVQNNQPHSLKPWWQTESWWLQDWWIMGRTGSDRRRSAVTQLWFSSKAAWLPGLLSDQGVVHQALSPVCCSFGRPLHSPTCWTHNLVTESCDHNFCLWVFLLVRARGFCFVALSHPERN